MFTRGCFENWGAMLFDLNGVSEEDFESNKPADDDLGTLSVEHFDFAFLVHFGRRSPPRKLFPA